MHDQCDTRLTGHHQLLARNILHCVNNLPRVVNGGETDGNQTTWSFHWKIYNVMPSSHCRHRQDKTVGDWKIWNSFVQSRNAVWTDTCLVLTQFSIRNVVIPIVMSYLETRSRLVHKCVHTADETGQDCSVSNLLRTTENCLWLLPTQFTPPTLTRRDSTALCRRCELAIRNTQIQPS